MANDLTEKVCRACEGDTPPLTGPEIAVLRRQTPNWRALGNRRLERKFKFKNFAEALAFVDKVGKLAEQEGHHPDITLGWGYADVTTMTHAISGLSENDFILAAKIDQLLQDSTLNREKG